MDTSIHGLLGQLSPLLSTFGPRYRRVGYRCAPLLPKNTTFVCTLVSAELFFALGPKAASTLKPPAVMIETESPPRSSPPVART